MASDEETTMSNEEFMNVAGYDGPRIKGGAAGAANVILPMDVLALKIYEKLPVSQEERLEMKRVDEQGVIFILPFGDITVGGLTTTQAEKAIEERLEEFVVSPHVEVSISKRAFEPHVFIFGEANKTGKLELEPGARLLKIIAEAGGVDANAYRRSIKVIRRQGTNVKMYSIDLYDLIAKGDQTQNILMQDQDVIFVPRRFYTNLNEVARIIGILLPWYYFVNSAVAGPQ